MIKRIRRRKTLGYRTIRIMAVFSICLILGISVLAAGIYLNMKIRDTHDLAYAYVKATASYIDGDRVSHYFESKKEDDYYLKVANYIDTLRGASRINFLYVVVPTENGSVFIWDAKNMDAGTAYALGKFDPYEELSRDILEENFKVSTKEKLYITQDSIFGYLVSAFYPILDSKGKPVAIVGADLAIETISEESMAFIGTIVFAIIFIVAVFTLILYSLTEKRIITPVIRLSESSKKLISSLSSGRDISLDIHTGDEIEELAASFKTMHTEITGYLKSLSKITAEKEHIGTEMHVATSIQSSMLPKLNPEFAPRHDFSIYALMSPAKEVGGDFYDAFLIDDEHLGVVIADVSDKGVPAALFMVISKTLIKLRCQLSGSLSPARVFKSVNNQLIENNDAGMFVTCWLAIINLKTGEGRASNAGHEHPVLKRAGEEFRLVEYQHSPPLGCLDDLEFEEHEFKLHPGDTFFVYTDGLAEAVNEDGEQFGTGRIVEALNAHSDLEPEALVEAARSELSSFVGKAEQFDDTTMLAFTYHGT